MKNTFLHVVFAAALLGTLLFFPFTVKAEETAGEQETNILEPANGLDIKPDHLDLKSAPPSPGFDLRIKDNLDATIFGGAPKQEIPNRKNATDRRAFLGFTIHF